MSLLLLFNGGVIGPVTADLAVAEANDTLSATAGLEISGTHGVADDDDIASASGALAIAGSSPNTEADDSGIATAMLHVTATMDHVEGDDGPSSSGAIAVMASLAAFEADDALLAGTTLALAADLSAFENDDTLASFTQMPLFYPRRGGVDEAAELERRQREWREDLRRIIERSFGIARGEIDPVTFERIPPPDYSKVTGVLVDEASALDAARAQAFMAATRRAREDEAIAVLLLAA